MADLAADGLMPVTDQTLATFLTGNLGMLVDSSFQRINTPKQAKFNIRFLAMPTPDGKTPKVPAGGNGAMMFSKTPEQQQAAWKMIRWLTEAEASTLVADNCGYLPPNQAVIKELIGKYGDDLNYKVILEQAARVTPWYSWPGKNSNKIAKVLRDMQEARPPGQEDPAAGPRRRIARDRWAPPVTLEGRERCRPPAAACGGRAGACTPTCSSFPSSRSWACSCSGRSRTPCT